MGKIRQTLDRSQVTDDTPLRLDQAVDIFFYEGSGITVSSLRREHKRGRLQVFTIAGKQFTTLAYLRQMMEACQVPPETGGTVPSPYGRDASGRVTRWVIRDSAKMHPTGCTAGEVAEAHQALADCLKANSATVRTARQRMSAPTAPPAPRSSGRLRHPTCFDDRLNLLNPLEQ